jgi:hypothetical protein
LVADRDIPYEVLELEYVDLMEVRRRLKEPPDWLKSRGSEDGS